MDLFIPAANFNAGRLRPIRFLGIHATATVCTDTSAEAVARFFAGQKKRDDPRRKKGDPLSSAHRTFDRNSIVQSVKAKDTAFAIPGANTDGFHNELSGMATWSTARWLEEQAMLNWAATGIAEELVMFRRLGVPFLDRYLTIPEIRDPHGPAGLLDHGDATKAFKTVGGHTDCGDGFPRVQFVGKVRFMVGLLDRPAFRPSFI